MKSYQNNLLRQTGSTFMGLILGLIIGLGIAVAVALLISKSSTPFTNKNGKSDKADLPITQMQDPNKPLYGNKDAAKEAAKDFVKPQDAANSVVPPAETKPANAIADKSAEAKADSKSDPKAELKSDAKVENKPADAAAKTELTDDKYVYFLQAGAFREAADAESARAKLALLGFEAKINEKSSDNGILYRVRMGPFAQLETMNRMKSKLNESSVDVAVVRTTK